MRGCEWNGGAIAATIVSTAASATSAASVGDGRHDRAPVRLIE
jgi:hypothetical protein